MTEAETNLKIRVDKLCKLASNVTEESGLRPVDFYNLYKIILLEDIYNQLIDVELAIEKMDK